MTNRIHRAFLSGAVRCLTFGLVGLVWGCGAGRAAESDQQQNAALCTDIANTYETQTTCIGPCSKSTAQDYEGVPVGATGGWWSWADKAAGSTPPSVTVKSLEDDPATPENEDITNCGHKRALVWDSGVGHNDYGGGFGPGPNGDMCGADDASADCKWEGLGFWVRVPAGSDPSIKLTLQDYQTAGTTIGGVTRECTMGDQTKTFTVPLLTCYVGVNTPTWGPACANFNTIASTADTCRSPSDCPGADQACPRVGCEIPVVPTAAGVGVGTCRYDWSCGTCTDWSVKPIATPKDTDAGWNAKCTADADCPDSLPCVDGKCAAQEFPAADCGTSKMPAYGASRCDMWQFFNQPLACALTNPPLASSCGGWTFLVNATTSWSFVTVPFSSMAPAPVDVGGGQSAPGRAFESLDSRYVAQLLPAMPNSEATMQFYVDEIDLYRAKPAP